MSDTVAFITGANKGIGFEVARRLSERGATVVIGARDPTLGREAADRLRADWVQLDVTDADTVATALAAIDRRHARLDVLVNNAGISGGSGGAPSEVDADLVRHVYETNVFGVVTVTRAALPLLRRSTAPRIVNVSSGLGSLTQMSDPGHEFAAIDNLPYQSSKAALNAITICYAKELAGAGIKVNAADPGFTSTDFNRHRGYRTVEQAANVVVRLATLGPDGETGTFQDEAGTVPW